MRDTKPKVSEVKEWLTLYSSEKVVVQEADIDSAFRRVIPSGMKPKYFWGETAWSDSARYASDFDFQAWEVSVA